MSRGLSKTSRDQPVDVRSERDKGRSPELVRRHFRPYMCFDLDRPKGAATAIVVRSSSERSYRQLHRSVLRWSGLLYSIPNWVSPEYPDMIVNGLPQSVLPSDLADESSRFTAIVPFLGFCWLLLADCLLAETLQYSAEHW